MQQTAAKSNKHRDIGHNMGKFKKGVAEKLDFYIYRLIDPRNGHTFYVGKGKNDRVFTHVRGELNPDPNRDETDEKIKKKFIQELLDMGLEPQHIIHRHGIKDEKTAYQVEAAVMDAFLINLTNEVKGHYSDEFGPATVEQLNKRHEPEYIPEDSPVVVIKITKKAIDKEDGSYYRTVRASWIMAKSRFEEVNSRSHHVAAIRNMICVGLYSVPAGGWKASHKESEDARQRYEFDGERADDEMWNRYVGKRFGNVSQWPVHLVGDFK